MTHLPSLLAWALLIAGAALVGLAERRLVPQRHGGENATFANSVPAERHARVLDTRTQRYGVLIGKTSRGRACIRCDGDEYPRLVPFADLEFVGVER